MNSNSQVREEERPYIFRSCKAPQTIVMHAGRQFGADRARLKPIFSLVLHYCIPDDIVSSRTTWTLLLIPRFLAVVREL
jgi:hypothetical protein